METKKKKTQTNKEFECIIFASGKRTHGGF